MIDYTIDHLNSKCEKMFAYLKEPSPSMDQEDKVMERLMMLGKMVAESGEYKAVAQYHVDEIIHGEISKAIDRAMGDKVSASTINLYVKTAARHWNYLVMAFDRINSAAAKVMMSFQTMISFEKEKMKML